MSDPEYDIDPMLIQSALDQGQSLVEPTLAQLDEWSKNTIMNLLYVWEPVLNEETGQKELRPTRIRYKDIHNVTGYALSHLNMVMNYSWPESRAALLAWRNGVCRQLKSKYRRDYDAITIINTLDKVFSRNTLGGSSDGTHQDYIETQMGANKKLTVGRE